MFAPDVLAQDARYLPGPLAVALQNRRQMEVFCTAPLVMDFLSLALQKGFPDLWDTNNLRHKAAKATKVYWSMKETQSCRVRCPRSP